MKDYDQLITKLKIQVVEATAQLARLEDERKAYLEQRERRLAYLSSREILELLEARHGRSGSMASIKRWADSGYLGEVVDERDAFPLLVSKQGNKRFLYPRESVLHFLHEKGLFSPAFEVLDRVHLKMAPDATWALITSIERSDHRFTYQVQLETTGDVLTTVAEEDLYLP